MKTRELPEKINPGDELEVQLAPIGEWPNVTEKDGTFRFGQGREGGQISP